MTDTQPRYASRRKILTVRQDAILVAETIRQNFAADKAVELRAF